MAKGQALPLLKAVAKSAQNDRQSTHVNKQTHGPKAKAHKETTYPHQHDLSWHDQSQAKTEFVHAKKDPKTPNMAAKTSPMKHMH